LSSDNKVIKTMNPATGEIIQEYEVMTKEEVNDKVKKAQNTFQDFHARYKKVSERLGAEIKGVYYITRSEPFPSLYENADFSVDTIKALIKDGKLKTNQKLEDIKKS
jgi:hypothetical protein